MQKLTKNQKLWVAALRSGDYNQTTGRLQDDTGFCCLGVVCDVYEKATNHTLKRRKFENAIVLEGAFLDHHPGALDWIQIKETSVVVRMNDSDKASFSEIADYVEAHPEDIFLNTEDIFLNTEAILSGS